MRYRDLKEIPGSMIVCSAGCDGEYSATPGDYFMVHPDSIIKCSECGGPMKQVIRHTRYEEVE